MPKGLRVPVEVTPRGGARTIEDSRARKQNILLGVKPASSLHPWNQELTPPEEAIFDINDDKFIGGILMSRIYSFFEEQEALGYSRLSKGSDGLQISSRSDSGEAEVVINYTDLEDNKSREVRFGPGRK